MVGAWSALMTCAVVVSPTRASPPSQMADVWGFAAVALAVLGVLGPKLLLPGCALDQARRALAPDAVGDGRMRGRDLERHRQPGWIQHADCGNRHFRLGDLGIWRMESRTACAPSVPVDESFATPQGPIELNYQRHDSPRTSGCSHAAPSPSATRCCCRASACARASGDLAVLLSLMRAFEGAQAEWWTVPATMSIALLFVILAWWAWQPQLLIEPPY